VVSLKTVVIFYPIFSLAFWVGAHGAVPGNKKPPLKLITTNAGRVGDDVVTSREVKINSFIEDVLYRPSSPKKLFDRNLTDRFFLQEVTAVLLEKAIAIEGRDLPLAKVSQDEIKAAREKLLKKAQGAPGWKSLSVEQAELKRILTAKLVAKKFIGFKVDSAALPVSDQDALAYFQNNRFKFESLPFEKFKDNIKGYLRKKQVDDRLREWFEVLKIKYSIRNHLAERAET